MDEIVMIERLARIEAHQQNQGKQLEKVLLLLDRMVRVEERQQSVTSNIKNMKVRLAVIETELDAWRTVRKVIGWVVGIVGTVIAGGILLLLRSAST